jgi:drug/metabolite transporter (DMT)-like permease
VFVLIWSTGFIVARYGMPHAPPLKFLAVRYALSILCFLPCGWAWRASRWPATRRQWGHLAVTGVLMQAGLPGGCLGRGARGHGRRAGGVAGRPAAGADRGSGCRCAAGAVTRRQWAGLVLGFAGLVLVVSRKFGDRARSAC